MGGLPARRVLVGARAQSSKGLLRAAQPEPPVAALSARAAGQVRRDDAPGGPSLGHLLSELWHEAAHARVAAARALPRGGRLRRLAGHELRDVISAQIEAPAQ